MTRPPTPVSSTHVAGVAPLSDEAGRIAHVFLALPGWDRQLIEPLLSCFRGIRAALGSAVRCTVLFRPAQADAVRAAVGTTNTDEFLWEDGFVIRLRDAQSRIEGGSLRVTSTGFPDFTNWVQDVFLVALDGSGAPTLWPSPRVSRRNGGWDDVIAQRLAAHLGWPIMPLPCAVEAGNVLVGRDVLVGSAVRRAATDDEWQRLVERLAGAGRRVVVPAHDRPQPLFHLDLYVTPAGSDPATGSPRALVGSLALTRDLLGRRLDGLPVADEGVDEGLDAVAAELAAAGYLIQRLPLLPFAVPGMNEPACYSYNNCLLEVDGPTHQRVLLPSYGAEDAPGLAALDAEAVRVWRSLGFETHLVSGDFAALAELYGSLRCMTKVLRRV